MRKQTICIGENKVADQLRGNRESDQRLCFRSTDSTFLLLLKLLALCCDCTARFVSDVVGNKLLVFSLTGSNQTLAKMSKMLPSMSKILK